MDEQIRESAQSDAQRSELEDFYRKYGLDEKGIDNFFLEIVRTEDTKKVGNLTETELGTPQIPVRTLFDIARDCKLIPSMSSFVKDAENQAENVLATSLSKDGFLIKARITQKKEFLDKDKKKKVRKSLFGRKIEDTEETI